MLPLGSSTGGASTGQSYELASKKEPAQRPSYRGLVKTEPGASLLWEAGVSGSP